MAVLLAQGRLLDANAVDYVLLALYFVFVLGIGYVARRAVSTSLDFFLS
ncbi:solute:Na+ symporter, SSS family, partial [Saccharopolyspora antimicrobica]